MSRTFQDRNLLEWTAFASTGKQGFTNDPHIVFQCTTTRDARPRWTRVAGDEGTAEALLITATDDDILALFQRSQELP